MARTYGYQYDTNPRKLDENYRKRNINPQNRPQKKSNQSNAKKTQNMKIKKAKLNFLVVVKFMMLFAILFLILFRNSQISTSFSKIQSLKASMTELKKENDQLEVNIQNSINLNHIEQKAKDLLGMQKRTNKQTKYINLPKKDYVEHRTEEVIIEENKNCFDSVIENIKNLF